MCYDGHLGNILSHALQGNTMSHHKDYFRNKKNYAPPMKTMSRHSVFDSIGPEGKVRGTAQQLAERYYAGGNDALRNGDMVLAHASFQHAEHYHRLWMSLKPSDQDLEAEEKRKERFTKPRQERPLPVKAETNSDIGIIAPPLKTEEATEAPSKGS